MSKVSLELPFPVSINGRIFEGAVKAEKELADELKRIVSEFEQNGKALAVKEVKAVKEELEK
jgi:hypothetical protein